MSDKDEKSGNDEGTLGDGDTKNPETITEGIATLDSIKKIEDVSAKSLNMPRSGALEGSGDQIESEFKELTKEFSDTDAGKENVDDTAQTKATGLDDDKIENINTDSDLIEAKSSETDVIPENDESNDENKLKKIDDHNDNEDEEMTLRWDDDNGCNVGVGDDSRSSDTKINDGLSEDQLLEEPSDVTTKEISELLSDENFKGSEKNLDLLKDSSLETSIIGYKTPNDDEATNRTKTEIEPNLSTEKDIPTEKSDDENISNILKDKHLLETDTNAEMINSPEMCYSSEESLDHQKILDDKLPEDTEQNSKASDIDQVKEITEDKDENLEENDTLENNLLKDVSNDETKETLDDIIEEDKLLAESESDLEAETATPQMPSLTDVVLNQVNDNVTAEKNLLEDSDPSKATESTEIILKNDKEASDDVLLEEKLLEEPETAGVISDTDAAMDVDDEKEGELLKDDESVDGISTPMDVDITDTSTENQVKMDDKIEDLLMVDQSEVATKDTDDINDKERSDDQDKTVDLPIEDTTETVDTSKDMSIEEQSQTADIIKEIALEEKIAAEIEEIEEKAGDEPVDDENREEDSEKDQSTVKSNTTEESENTSKQADILPTSNTPDVEIKEGKDKIDPEKSELTTETANPDKILDKNSEEVEVTGTLDKNLDETQDTDEVSPENNSAIFPEIEIGIKTGHGLHKPDVMLEIPTQELIDMDDTDLSMNLDQSEIVDSTNDIDEEVETGDKIITLDEDEKIEETITENVKPGDKTADKDVSEDDTVNKTSVDPQAKVTEKTADEIDSKVNEKAIVTDLTVSEVQTGDVVESATDAVDDKVESATDAMDDKVESATTDVIADDVDEGTVEENMERMFADVQEVSDSCETTVQVKKPAEQPPAEQPTAYSTQMTPDTSDEVPEISDSLGLLAESAGRMMDDEEPDDDDDNDEDDDFDQDESSNQISAEQSEDSNPAALESEPPGDQEKSLVTPDPKDEEFEYSMKMEVDIEEYGTLQLQAESMHEMNEETKSAVDALLRDNGENDQPEEQQETTEQMDIETVKLSDTSDYEIDVEPTEDGQAVAVASKEFEEQQDKPKKSPSKSPSKSNASPKQSPSKLSQSPSKQSPSKLKNLAITTQEASSFLNIVDLEESSSSEDEIQEVQKQPEPETTQNDKPPSPDSDVTNVNIPTGIDIMCTSGGNTSEITTKEGEVVISGVPKPPPHKPARLNMSEVSIKTVSATEPIVIPETKMNEQAQSQSKHKLSLEIFSLDSDEEDSVPKDKPSPEMSESELARETNKCINYCCKSDSKVPYKVAEPSEVAFYDASRKKRAMVCQPCADMVADRSKKLMQGIKDMTPIMDLEMGNYSHDLVQISDSESEDEEMVAEEPKEPIGEKGAKFIEDNLAKYLNDTWKKYDMDVRLKETQIMLDDEIQRLEQDSKEIDAMLNECQVATDKLRNELYATFECRREELPPIILYDTPETKYIGLEEELNPPASPTPPTPPTPSTPPTPPTPPTIEVDIDIRPTRRQSIETRQAKRRLSSTSETPAKRPAIPLGYATLDSFTSKDNAIIDYKIEDDIDVSVVKLSAESAPADLPPPGEISRPPLRVSMHVYAMKNAFGPWLKGKVLEIQPKNISGGHPFSLCRVKFDHKTKNNGKVLPARCIAYSEPADVRMTIGTRLIALFKDSNKRESYYSGVVSEIPTPMNNYRYLVFFDDGYAQYVQHQHTRLVCESSPLVWEEVHPFSREFVRKYLLAYPERPMVRLHEGQHLKTEWNGKWWSSRITRVDASLAQVMFVGDGRREWIYRGSTRLAPLYLELRAALRHRVRPMPRSKAQPRSNMPYVEYTRSDEPGANKHAEIYAQHQQQQNEEIRRQRAVAKKSTSAPPQVFPPSQREVAPNMDPVTSRVVYYTPKNAVKPLHMVPHRCSPKCKRNDVLSLKELRTYNPLAKPLLSGWERQIIRFKGHKEVMYRAPCGRRLRDMRELHSYLRAVASDLPVDLFDFHYSTHCLAEFVLNKCLVGKKDLSHGKENVPVPCVNYYDDSLPEFCSYNTERTPTAGVPLNLSPEFLCGCDCTDDCQDKSKCACWKMTLEGARTIGLKGPNVGYVYKRLPEPLPSGIYECNSRCKCKHTCLNRVAQHPLQLKLQVFKTPNRGWGIRALNDVPKGSFLCVYAGNLLTDATANLDGLNEGDEYLAELDYIEVVEQMKEGYEEDIPDADKKLDKKDPAKDGEDSDDEPSSSEEEDTASKTDKEDDDFRPGYIGLGVTEFNKRLRRREKSKKDKDEPTADDKEKDINKDSNTDIKQDGTKETSTDIVKEEIKEIKEEIKEERKEIKEGNGEEDCITISDDEEVREPSRFMVQDNMKANEYISKYKSVRTLFGMDEACYIMDAKVQGNIGRYLNHSCCPNVFVQNVFVDTHDPRFPWVAFFALSHIKAGTELTWNYNYDVGSVPGKILYCYCGAANCRGRLL